MEPVFGLDPRNGVGNRIEQRATPPGGSQTISTLGYPATSNRVTQITQNATTVRSIGYDAAGNITADSRLGSLYAYTYNNANRLKTVSYEGNLKGTYTYNGLHQLITRAVTNSGTLDGTAHYVHDRGGNVIAELNASGATVREYIWLPEAEIAPTAASRATIDRPIAVVDGVGGASPATYYVHADHLHRPIRMTNAAKSIVWSAEYQPWGAVQSVSGALTLDLRFPGQWFQLEAGLHYNWHRHYDASLGRYTQPDPLGFVDGPSVYGYARSNPYRYVDPDGRFVQVIPILCAQNPGICGLLIITTIEIVRQYLNQCKVEVDRSTKIGKSIELFPPITPPSGCSCNMQISGVFARAHAAGEGVAACIAAADEASHVAKVRAGVSHIHHTQGICVDSRGNRYKFIDKRMLRRLN